MNLTNMKIGTRLGTGFGVVLLLMTTLIIIGLLRLSDISDITSRIIEKDWVKAQAANTIDTTLRGNARKIMELLVTTDPVAVNHIHEQINANKTTFNHAMETLDTLVYMPEGKRLLTLIKEDHARYVTSFSKVNQLLVENQLPLATSTMLTDTLPTLDALQQTIDKLAAFQTDIVNTSGTQARQDISTARRLMIGMGLLAILIGASCAYWITRSIIIPIHQAVKIAQTVASGDLTSRIDISSQDEVGQLLIALNAMNQGLVKIVSEVRVDTNAIATASHQIAAGNLDLSARTEQQAASLEETASSMEELTSTVKQNADNARQANKLASFASDVALKGGTVVSDVVKTMSSINNSSKKIADIINVIDGIAFQTNILALNAAVEAARAGEQGRGFAVVASEVRNLAQRSAAAAKEIKVLIDGSVEQVTAGSKLVDQAGATMQEIVSSVQRVTDVMSEITAASQEQTLGIEQINQAIMQMDQATQQNAALVEQAAAAASCMQDQSGNLASVVSVFKLDSGHTAHLTPATAVRRPALVPATPSTTNTTPRASINNRTKKPIMKLQSVTSTPRNTGPADNSSWEEF